MSDEPGFLRELLAHPDDRTTRLVYADWLDEQGDVRGEFLRLELRLAELPRHDERVPWIEDRLRELRQRIDPGWLAQLDRTKIEQCPLRFRFRCPLRWEKLGPTADPGVRYCHHCGENVYHCSTIEEAREHALHGNCVAVDSRLTRTRDDLRLGPAFEPVETEELLGELDDQDWEMVDRDDFDD
jgi:uncharacterized protein (TIGR02996 family)